MAIQKSASYRGKGDSSSSSGRVQYDPARGVIVNDGSNNIGLFGIDESGNVVIKIAKPGFNADTASDDELIFNSSQDIFKIAYKGTTTINVPDTSSNTYFSTITHNLGYVPYVIAFVKPAFGGSTIDEYQPMPYMPTTHSATLGNALVILEACQVSATSPTQVTFSVSVGVDDNRGDWIIEYYLLQESVA